MSSEGDSLDGRSGMLEFDAFLEGSSDSDSESPRSMTLDSGLGRGAVRIEASMRELYRAPRDALIFEEGGGTGALLGLI
jgi:hypothetical protein